MSENKAKPKASNNNNDNKKRKHKFLPTYKAVKKGSYPVKPGVKGFFITCDGGRERQASNEAINVIDSFYEELVLGKVSSVNDVPLHDTKVNKKVKFTYSDSDDDGNDNEDGASGNDQKDKQDDNDKSLPDADDSKNKKSSRNENSDSHEEAQINGDDIVGSTSQMIQEPDGKEPPVKKQCTEEKGLEGGNVISNKVQEKSIDQLIEEELKELGDKSKRRFLYLDAGCNGLVFVQMKKTDADPSPTDIVQHMMMSLASTKKHISRFLLRVLPIEVTCYASEDEITKAIKPLISQHFPSENHGGHKFAVLYDARANTGIDRMKIINAVAKCVPAPHKVDLNNPDKNIVVQIAKTVCMIGVVEKYKELGKFNVRQLTTPTP